MLQKTKSYIFYPLISLFTGGASAFLCRDYFALYQTAEKPFFSPPAWLFPVVWTILYLLMGISAARISQSLSQEKDNALLVFAAQLVINFFWPIIFFVLQGYVFACIWLALLLVLVAAMTLEFRKVDPLAAGLQVPYILWTAFALALNIGVAMLN